MHKIYYAQRCLLICSREEYGEDISGYTVLPSGTSVGTAVSKLLDQNEDCCLALICDNVAQTYAELSGGFKQVNAAGGLVRNASGDMLVMFRNGVWDLPKGHQEPGGSIEDTAGREIAEETGVKDLKRGDLICITDHCYFRGDVWHLKHTWWFDFFCKTCQVTKPQTEEGISSVVWSHPAEIPEKMKNTYPSIREVFEKAVKLFDD